MNKTPMTPLLEMRGLRLEAGPVKSPTVILHGLDLTLRRGEVLGLVGESGAGKSSAGLAAMGVVRDGVRFAGGSVRFDGVTLTDLSPAKLRRLLGRRMAYVAQSAAASFNPAHRVLDQVTEAPVLHQTASRSQAQQEAIALFRQMQLPDPDQIGLRYPHQLSGGQLQRAMTGMAMACRPDLIVFDEPTTALDVTTQIEVLAAIKEAIRDTGVAALYITHDLAVVAQVADDIMVLRHGKMVECGATAQIIGAPREDYTRALVSVRQVTHPEKSAAADPLLRIEAVTARYRGLALDVLKDITLDLAPGRTLAVVGESGSGKSTLARVITGLLPPAAGSVRFDGRDLSPALSGRSKNDLRELQMIYQMADTAMNPRQTVATIIGRPLEFYFGLRGAERDRRVAELLDEIELGKGFSDRYPAELSGGQKQRVCIARALAARPRLIICDEVTSALDPLVADGILRLLQRLQQEEGVAYLFITHDIATVRAIADEIAVMHRGRVVRQGPKAQVLSPPFDDYTELLLASVPEMREGWLEEVIATRKAATPEGTRA